MGLLDLGRLEKNDAEERVIIQGGDLGKEWEHVVSSGSVLWVKYWL